VTPDGQFLVYRRDTPHEVAVLRDMLRSEDRVIESVGRPGQFIDGISISPDGTKITYIVHDVPSRRSTLYLRPPGGGEPRQLTRRRPEFFFNVAEWTPATQATDRRQGDQTTAADPPIDGD
jgi:hypothetical protein